MTPPSSSPSSPSAPRAAKASAGVRKSATKSDRSRAREFALQALYQYLVGQNPAEEVDEFTRQLSGFHKADSAHYDALLHGCIEIGADLDALMQPLLDRPLQEISPIERAALWIGIYELLRCPDIPLRVALNESIELAKEFGGTDGHKYVNAVLNGLAPQLRALEFSALPAASKVV
jgi:N utilization substance protein B